MCGIEDLERRNKEYYQKQERSTPIQLMGEPVYIERGRDE